MTLDHYPVGAAPLKPWSFRYTYSAEPHEALPTHAGIYAIYVVGAPGVYIGQAECLKERWTGHVTLLRRGESSNPNLRLLSRIFPLSAFNCEALEVFDHPLLPRPMPKIDLDVAEGAWMYVFKKMGVLLYNTRPTSPECSDPDRPGRRRKGSVCQINPEHVLRSHCYRAIDPLSNVGIEV